MAKQQYSFELLFHHFFILSLALLFGLLGGIVYLLSASLLFAVTAFLVVIVPYCFYAWHVKASIKTPLLGLAASLEAIRNEDYSLRTHPKFNSGAIKDLSNEVNLMADDLKIRKSHYDQQAVLVLNLIEQLATPIAVFDQNGRLNHANDAFSSWCGKPWLQVKRLSAQALGLDFQPQKEAQAWQIQDRNIAKQWQLRHSCFSMLGDAYQLVVLTNIETVVNEAERLAWYKMTRVLSHEINNSLSPIKSLSQSLVEVFASQSDNKSAVEALQVIASRSEHLMQFVNRYASLNQQFEVRIEEIKLAETFAKVAALFTHPITVNDNQVKVKADAILLEQVLINLLKNAIEASSVQSPVIVSATKIKAMTEIKVEDFGSGIANPDNLFVPFYTTKAQGKGIGLALSRNMIEQQGGRLKLNNKADKTGAEAQILLN